jgi:hypothetical protein
LPKPSDLSFSKLCVIEANSMHQPKLTTNARTSRPCHDPRSGLLSLTRST